ncbi:hypothetical protein ACNHUS_05970 [Actinomycetes bacterium M1A6_2h]
MSIRGLCLVRTLITSGAIGSLLAAGIVFVPAVASADPGMTEVGSFSARGCVEVSGIVSIPPANAAAALPAGYVASSFIGLPGGPGIPGDTSLLMGVETCQDGTIDGVRVTEPFSFGERVISVDRQDATPGYHFYAAEQVSDNEQIVDMLTRAGFPATYVPGVSGVADSKGGTSRGGSVTIVDDAPLPQLPSPLSSVSIWHESAEFTSALRLDVVNPTAQVGVATVTADAGSPIATVMGAHSATGIGAINRFDLNARVLTR